MMARMIFDDEEKDKLDGVRDLEEALVVDEGQPMQHQHGNQYQDAHLDQHSTAGGISVQI